MFFSSNWVYFTALSLSLSSLSRILVMQSFVVNVEKSCCKFKIISIKKHFALDSWFFAEPPTEIIKKSFSSCALNFLDSGRVARRRDSRTQGSTTCIVVPLKKWKLSVSIAVRYSAVIRHKSFWMYQFWCQGSTSNTTGSLLGSRTGQCRKLKLSELYSLNILQQY